MRMRHIRTMPMPKNVETRRHRTRKCNLCTEDFQCRTPFDRFCPICKKENELFKFGNCFPEIEDIITQPRLTAWTNLDQGRERRPKQWKIESEESGAYYYCAIEIKIRSDEWRSYESDRSLHDALKNALRDLKPARDFALSKKLEHWKEVRKLASKDRQNQHLHTPV